MYINVDREELVTRLRNDVLEIEFNRVDGEYRHMTATLVPQFLPKQLDEENSNHKSNPNVVALWDVNKGAWRSVRLDRVISISELSDGILDQNHL